MIKRATDRIEGEREERLKLARDRIKTGVPFLDTALGGLRKNDILLLGASSGAGKTELVSQIAKANVQAGKRVHFFALEAEEKEIERRILYKLIANSFFRDPDRPYLPISYVDWLLGKLDHLLIPYETEAQKIFLEKYQTLFTIYRRLNFDLSVFEKLIRSIEGHTDLVIIDHLSYFDLNEGVSENQAVTQIVKRIRDLALICGIPMILVAHMRKKDRFSKALMPDLEDFMGSSNVYKIATQAVLLAPSKDEPNIAKNRWPTFMRIAKSRTDGSLNRYIARCFFNSEKNEYEAHYQLGFFKEGMETFEPISDDLYLPRWAKQKD